MRACLEEPVCAELIPALPGFPLEPLWLYQLSQRVNVSSPAVGSGVGEG